MREVIVVCRSRKASRDHVARVLDRYLWRIGDRTWRGKASNACLDRMARELRKKASRATAVSIQEVRSSVESRMPLIRIGSRSMFSEDGLVPVSSHPSAFIRSRGSPVSRNGLAAVRIAALFHDLGKATVLFQDMIQAALAGVKPEASFLRHELFSAAVWDRLFGKHSDRDLRADLLTLTPAEIDVAVAATQDWLLRGGSPADRALSFDFLLDETRITFAVGMLILTHHRIPEGDSDHLGLNGAVHSGPLPQDARRKLEIADGVPFWHEEWFSRGLRTDASRIVPGIPVEGLDIALRGSLVFADHVGSAQKEEAPAPAEHLANTTGPKQKPVPADSLSAHVRRVHRNCVPAFDLLHRLRDRFPALGEDQMPGDLVRPEIFDRRFAWQMEAARAARDLAGSREGGFFACLISGTGTGKTRGAPTILAGAAFGDIRPERRYFRMTLGLGLRVLATQSAREYIKDLRLPEEDIAVLVGKAPIEFPEDGATEDPQGSDSLSALPDWLRVEQMEGGAPPEGSAREAEWLRGLSLDTDRGLPAILQKLVAISGKKAGMLSLLAGSPVIVGTVDHLMEVAAPRRTRFLPAAIRTLSSDLILDEIDQYGAEDLAALARLVFQAAAGGRRVILMSATLTRDVGEALHAAYRAGWAHHAASSGMSDHVHILLTGDAPGSFVTNADGTEFGPLYDACRGQVLAALATAPALRRGEVLAPCSGWNELLMQIEQGCSRMHDLNASEINGFRVSVGLVRMTRISHTAALFQQMASGDIGGRLRVKVCLHSNFPRLHRAWIEDRLKRALTRKKKDDPNEGLRSLCHAEDLFERADAIGARDIEIVCVTSPVIETGNDLDFDYAILDPVSMRSIIQAAGRVRRHRPAAWAATNTLILGRSPIVMQGRKLAMPGVETDLPRETLVSRGNLSRWDKRNFSDLAGEVSFATITAAPILSDDQSCPLREEEARLRRDMLVREGASPPLGRYLSHAVSRMNTTFTRTRVFRRSTTRTLRYALSGDGFSEGVWLLDVNSGQHPIIWRVATGHGLSLSEPAPDLEDGYLFTNILERAWLSRAPDGRPISDPELRDLVTLDVAFYDNGRTTFPQMTYGEQTGFTRNSPEDLFQDFGSN
ncbi:hypothetical protein [Marivita sp.]|uniref:hypothetical protein n=1 Tax=Marivita sp. TaxID=2003365 RepID=UPI00345871A5